MPSLLFQEDGVSNSTDEKPYGLHKWTDGFGHCGTEVLSQHHIASVVTQFNDLFAPGAERLAHGLAEALQTHGDSKLKVFVVIDNKLQDSKQAEIQRYFARCKAQNLLEAYKIWTLAPEQTDPTFENIAAVAVAAKHFGIRRRDQLIAIGSFVVTELVGFTAAIYRRGTPWISIPTDPIGILVSNDSHHKVAIDHKDHYGKFHKRLLSLPHLPTASFHDLSFSVYWSKTDVAQGLAENIRLAATGNEPVFSYLEAGMDNISKETGEPYLKASIELFVRTISHGFMEKFRHNRTRLDEVLRMVLQQIFQRKSDHGHVLLMATALSSALSYVKGKLFGQSLKRILNLLDRAGLSLCEINLDYDLIWGKMINVIQEWYGTTEVAVVTAVGKETTLRLSDFSPNDMKTALAVVFNRDADFKIISCWPNITPVTHQFSNRDRVPQRFTKTDDVKYHVITAAEIFNKANPTIIQSYCINHNVSRRMKVLVVMDNYDGNSIPVVREYFDHRRAAIESYTILPMNVTNQSKNIGSVFEIINAALDLQMSSQDLFIVVGGGTLMDVVGFAAAMYKGGTPYLKIPTNLLGMIDAGVAVKVGVNLGHHKNFIGSYFAPIGCVISVTTFLSTVSRRELACGLSESLKMAIIKSPRLFQIIEQNLLEFQNPVYTNEFIQISTQKMLEELQPNLHEKNLMRLADFGHEFGHIIESLALNKIPHGECVAMGMGISTYIAYLKGLVSQSDRDRILCLMLDAELPIYAPTNDCCNTTLLWNKICTDAIEHKHGMLYLVVPEGIGKASFLIHLSEINASMVAESIFGLRRFAEWHAGRQYITKGRLSSKHLEIDIAGNGLLLVGSSSVRNNIQKELSKLQTRIKQILAKRSPYMDLLVVLPTDKWHLSISGFGLEVSSKGYSELTEELSQEIQRIIAMRPTSKAAFKGMYICGNGDIVVQVIVDDAEFNKRLGEILTRVHSLSWCIMEPHICIVIGKIAPNIFLNATDAKSVRELVEQDILDKSFGQSDLSCTIRTVQQNYSLPGSISVVQSIKTAAIIESIR